MSVGADLYMYDVVKKLTFAISSPDEFLVTVKSSLCFCFNDELFCGNNISSVLHSVY